MRKFLAFVLILILFLPFKVSFAKNEFLVTNTNSSGTGSFLYAIKEAIESGGSVKFDIPEDDKNFNGKYWVIKLKSPIPEITSPITIDGLSQTLKHGNKNLDGPEIVIDASMVTGSETLFYFRRSGFEISGIEITGFNGKSVIEVKGAKGSIHDILIRDGNVGIHLYKGSGVNLFNSQFRDLTYGVYLYYSNFNKIDGIDIKDCDYGIRLYYSMSNEIKNSTVMECDSGIRIFYNSIGNKVHNNKLIKNRDGVWLRDSHNMKNDIYENEFLENTNGLHLLYGTDAKVYSNKFDKNEIGVFVESFSERNEIYKNTFKNNKVALSIKNYSTENLIRENNFDSNERGIVIEDETSTSNTLSKNTITKNSFRGIIINSNKKTPPPKILTAGILGKGLIIKTESDLNGTVEVFLSNYTGESSPHPLDSDSYPYHGDSRKFIGDFSVEEKDNISLIITDKLKVGDFITTTLTNPKSGTSEFSLNRKLNSLAFLDAILTVSSKSERGGRVKFILKIKNKGESSIEGVSFKCSLPSSLKDVKLDSIPSNSKGGIDGNSISVENINIGGNSFVSLSFSALIPLSLKVGDRISIQGEVEYYPVEGFLIKEKTDKDEFDDEVPGSSIGDDKTEFVVSGKGKLNLNINLPKEINSGSTFDIDVSIKNIGNDTAKDVNFKFELPEGIEFVNADNGSYNSKDGSFNLIVPKLKVGEEKKLKITLKGKDSSQDVKVSLNFILYGEGIEPIKERKSLTIKGEGKERINFNVKFKESVNLLEEFEVEIYFENVGDRISEEKLVKLNFDDGVKFISSNPTVIKKKNEIVYTLKPLSPQETKEVKLKFKVFEGCKTDKKFTLFVGDERRDFKVSVNCLIVYHHPIISGFKDKTFRPNEPLRRVEASVILTNALLLKPSISLLPLDVRRDYWGVNFISSVVGNGIMSGYPDGSFKPDRYMTRMEACAVVFKILSLKEDYSVKFKDVKEGYWGRGIIGAVVKEGIMSGYPDGSFKPDRYITRAEFLVIILKAIGRGKASFTMEGIFKDVDESFWAYPFIIEATVPHIVINPERFGNIRIKDRVFPVYGEKFNSIVKVLKIGDKIKASVPFLYPDMREIEITVVKVGIKP